MCASWPFSACFTNTRVLYVAPRWELHTSLQLPNALWCQWCKENKHKQIVLDCQSSSQPPLLPLWQVIRQQSGFGLCVLELESEKVSGLLGDLEAAIINCGFLQDLLISEKAFLEAVTLSRWQYSLILLWAPAANWKYIYIKNYPEILLVER